ncbi:hypothetical protein Y032_0025g1105 [Ancylostoma ceylanicum]|uniref:Uncharacterized protein n=1 Tax=Ancylostoma ceylanicum TaxID=53326 RepID=A0A016UUZ4_9BILA|nr:hypothetical protein Y032_0025g1105 [Ancylostoma ceylanicum]
MDDGDVVGIDSALPFPQGGIGWKTIRAYTGSISVKAQFWAHPADRCSTIPNHQDLPPEIIDDTNFLVKVRFCSMAHDPCKSTCKTSLIHNHFKSKEILHEELEGASHDHCC